MAAFEVHGYFQDPPTLICPKEDNTQCLVDAFLPPCVAQVWKYGTQLCLRDAETAEGGNKLVCESSPGICLLYSLYCLRHLLT